jgi:hypothetical protein
MVAVLRSIIVVLIVTLGGGFPVAVHAQIRAGGTQFVLNPGAQFSQATPGLAGDGQGRFVAAWKTSDPATGFPVYEMRRVRRDGKAFAAKIVTAPVAFPGFPQPRPFVAMSGTGAIALVWVVCDDIFNPVEAPQTIWLKFFDRKLNVVREAASINVSSANSIALPSLAFLDDGTLMVVWSFSGIDDPTIGGFVGRLFGPDGRALTEEIELTSGAGARSSNGFVVADAVAGEFLVGWSEQSLGGEDSTQLARYSAAGQLREPAAAIMDHPAPALTLAVQADGSYLAVWDVDETGRGGPEPFIGMMAQAFSANDEALGPPTSVNDFVPGQQALHRVVADGRGGYFVAWQSGRLRGSEDFGQDGDSDGIFGRRVLCGLPL